MPTYLDMPLDGMINKGSTSGRGKGQARGRGRGRVDTFRGRAMGMLQRGPLRVNTRPGPHRIAKSFSRAKNIIWQHDLFEDSMVAAGLPGIETATKLYISNLDFGVSNEDIKELFSEIGDLKRCAVHYDRNGRPNGSAEVVFIRRSDAMAALKRYNNVQLDGKAMKIEIVGTNLGLPIAPRVNVVGGVNGRGRRTVVMTSEFDQGGSHSFNRISGFKRGGIQQRGGGGGGRGEYRGRGQSGGRGRGRGRRAWGEKSADDLDRELESYHAGAKNTS